MNHHTFILFVGFLMTVQTTVAQVKVTGTVSDKKKPLPGVSVTLKGTYDGATSDTSGKFSFTTSEKGEMVLQFSCVGYRPIEQNIKLEPKGFLNIDVVLKEEVTELQAVVLTAGTFEASDRKRAAAVLDPIDIVTTASANGDITGALKTLPGAQQVGESEGLFVRGGTSSETKTYIDGTLVNTFFYSSVPNIAQFSRFSPFLFKGTIFSTGGYSALYGQALSSALILESIDLPEQSSGSLSVSVLNLIGGYQHLSKNKKSSFGASYGYTDLSLAFKVIKQRQDYIQNPAYHNADANFRIKTSTNGILKYYGYFSSSKLDFTVNSIDSLGYLDRFAITNTNFYHNLSWRENLGRKWKLNAGISYSTNKDEINSSMQDASKNDVLLSGLEFKNFGLDLKGEYYNTKLVIEKKLKGLSAIRFGGEYNHTNDQSVYKAYNGQHFPDTLAENIKSLFAETDIYLTNNVAAKIGARFEHSSYLEKTNLAPRVSLAYKLGTGGQASLAYGLFYQDPERRYLPSPNNLQFMRAAHYIAQYLKMSRLRTFRVEVFYKRYKDLVKTSSLMGRETAVNNEGFGNAKGIEIFWRDKKTIKDVDYWISYSYLDTKRDFLNFPYAIQPNFAAKHNGSFIVKKFVQKIKMNLNGSYNYSSGRPYYNIKNDGSGYKFSDQGFIPDYHNVSFAINWLPKLGKPDAKSFTVYVLQVSNIFNIKQTYGYQFSYDGMRKEAILPTSRIFVYVGAFISFGIDRTEDAINDRL